MVPCLDATEICRYQLSFPVDCDGDDFIIDYQEYGLKRFNCIFLVHYLLGSQLT